MKKKELLKRIETLEYRVNELFYRLERVNQKQFMYKGKLVDND